MIIIKVIISKVGTNFSLASWNRIYFSVQGKNREQEYSILLIGLIMHNPVPGASFFVPIRNKKKLAAKVRTKLDLQVILSDLFSAIHKK